jgi:CheY-like chemotaxis protein
MLTRDPTPTGVQALTHVLLVDDQAADIELYRIAMTERGSRFAFDVAKNGVEALASMERAIRDTSPHLLVVLDLYMPGSSGWMVLESAARQYHLAAIPIFVMTTSTDPADHGRALRLGARACWSKPTRLVDLVKLMGDAVTLVTAGRPRR